MFVISEVGCRRHLTRGTSYADCKRFTRTSAGTSGARRFDVTSIMPACTLQQTPYYAPGERGITARFEARPISVHTEGSCSEDRRWSGPRQLSRVRPIGAQPCGTRPGGVDSSMLSWSRRGGVPGTHGRTSGRSSGSRQLAIRWRVEPERPQAGRRFGLPALAESEQAVEPVRAVEMHAVVILEVKRRDPADRFAAAGALPMRHALAILHVPVIFDFAPSEPRCFVGGVKGSNTPAPHDFGRAI